MLKVEGQLLGHQGRRDKYVAGCLVGTPHASKRNAFKRFGITLYKPRWLNVVAYCKASMIPAHIIRETFSPDQYNGSSIDANEKNKGEGTPFSANELRRILDDQWYRGYKLSLIKANQVIVELDKWLDNCPCHHHLFTNIRAGRSTRGRMMKDDGLSKGHCPLVSCWGWQLTHGALRDLIAKLRLRCVADLVTEFDGRGLSSDVVARLLPEFHRAVDNIEMNLQIKSAWLNELPWSLLGLSHPNVAKAQAWARDLLQRWDGLPLALQRAGHRLSKKFLAAGILRSQLETFCATGST